MKLIHLSDLHLGKRVNDFSMLEDQRYILTKIISIIDDEKPDAVIIAGDIYDKSVPSVEAVQLFDEFLSRLHQRGLMVLAISGNHDSPERIAFGSRLMSKSGIYLSPVFDGAADPLCLTDEFGTVNIFMLPFVKPSHVRRYYPDDEILSYTDAIRSVIGHMEIDSGARNILVTHQFVTGALRCDSEDISVGGSDNVDAGLFHSFDYVALGHIHSPQSVLRETIRYCGTPLKYSFSEAGHTKSVTVVQLFEKGNVSVHTVPIIPKRDMAEIRGSYMEITARDFYKATDLDRYLHITLTDEEDIPDAIGKLRAIYPNIMKLSYDNARTRHDAKITGIQDCERKTPIELFSEFFEKQNNRPLSEEQSSFVSGLIEAIWEEMS
ncbi:MAG: exonuclease SbcCD subunit D [Clostridiales bacterium]|jgi:exonuclease SbcD|nr:exonuclease SbcCD subunit D [Clostridiales bacterium]